MRSKKLSPEKLMQLLEKYDIQFEGPVPPRKWPDRYKHLFQEIRNIWANRYDDYIERSDLNQETINKQKTRVRTVVDKAARFRRNIGSHENTWRDAIETPTIGLLVEDVVCRCCGNEVWDPDYEAYPLNGREKEELKRKLLIDEDSDEEQGRPIFQSVVGQEVSHESEDNLDNSKIPMKPDRVFGLTRTPIIRESIEACLVNLVHDPVKRDDMVYPFLVLEAKREINPPGFRAIEAQTAFSIRRFLRIQEDLQMSCQSNLHPLVWFFAYQGDEWRLYASIIKDGKTRIFQLWQGIIESEDCALQLLQIIDFIGTWARDVYRPQIRRSLAGLPSPYKQSPSVDGRVVWLQSRSPTSSQPFLGSVREEGLETQAEDSPVPEAENHGELHLQDASSHPFLRWALRRDISKYWALKSSIRHSDIVMFSFRVFEVPDTEDSLMDLMSSLQDDLDALAAMWHLLALMQENPYTFVFKRGDIPEMEKCWTGEDAQSSYDPSSTGNVDEAVRAFFFFRSYCKSNDWQVNREICCIVWSSIAAKIFGNHFSTVVELGFGESSFHFIPVSEVVQSFHQIQSLSGKYSLAYALQSISLVLQPFQYLPHDEHEVHWCSPQEAGLPTSVIVQLSTLFNSTFNADIAQLHRYQSRSLLEVFDTQQPSIIPPRLLQVGDNFGQLEAVLAIKPEFWPQECPRFCLFVLLDHDFDNDDRLRGLLHDTIRAHTYLAVYGHNTHDQPSWSADDEAVLQDWDEYFSEENMLRC